LFQPFGTNGVSLNLADFLKTLTKAFEQLAVKAIAGGGQGVKGPSPVVARDDEFSFAQVGKMTRGGRLWGSDDPDQIANAKLASLEKVKDAQAGAVGEGAKREVGVDFGFGRLHYWRTNVMEVCWKGNAVSGFAERA